MAPKIATVSASDTPFGICTLSNGSTMYWFGAWTYANNGYMYWCKSTDSGATWGSLNQIDQATMFGASTNTIGSIAFALDSAGYIHVVSSSVSSATRDVAYNKLNTSNDTWGTWEQVASLSASSPYPAGIAVDSSDYPHVVFMDYLASMGNSYYQIRYSNRTSGSWSSPVSVSSTATTNYYLGAKSIVIRGSDVVEVVYSTTSNCYYRTRTSGTWGSETSYDSTAGHTPAGILVQSSTVYRYSTSTTAIYEDGSSIITTSAQPYGPLSACIIGSNRYIFYIVASSPSYSLKYVYHNGSTWSTENSYVSGSNMTDSGYLFQWAYNNFYPSGSVNMGVRDTAGTSVWFYNFSPSSPVTISASAATLSASAQAVSVSAPPPAVNVSINVANLTTIAQAVSLSIGATYVPIGSALVSATPQDISLVPGAVTTTVNNAVLQANPQAIGVSATSYYGILKYWNGSEWIPKSMKVYIGGSWQTKPLKVYINNEWKEVDITGG